MYHKITPLFVNKLKKALGEDAVFTETETINAHAQDHTEKLFFPPEVVVKPKNTEGVSKVMKLCYKHRIPITVQGARSGLTGGALPVLGGVALSMERLDKILHIDAQNFQVTVEPAIITEHLQNVLKEQSLFYPPDPAGRGLSYIGGNIGTNAGGPRCVKYGVTRDYVLNLEIVLANGDIMWTGANTIKNSTGYNLTQLIVGSEGTLAVVTKIVLKLLPYPAFNLLMLAPFYSAEEACAAVAAIFQAGITPSTLEFMERDALDYAIRYVGSAPFTINPEHGGQLLIELDGNDMDALHKDCEKIAEVISRYRTDDILFADSDAQKNELWKLRRNMGNAMRQLSYAWVSEDTVVPRAKLPELLRGVKGIGEKMNFKSLCFGHVGDGNLHINIISDVPVTVEWRKEMDKAKRAIFELTKSLGGMLSAEHGVGYTQKGFMDVFFAENHIQILRGIKKVFDSRGILNPNKIF